MDVSINSNRSETALRSASSSSNRVSSCNTESVRAKWVNRSRKRVTRSRGTCANGVDASRPVEVKSGRPPAVPSPSGTSQTAPALDCRCHTNPSRRCNRFCTSGIKRGRPLVKVSTVAFKSDGSPS
ncbi:unnamed protein product, partial [Ectocarpus sp. 8 AP-2014]